MKEIIFDIGKEELKDFLNLLKEMLKMNDEFKFLFLENGLLVYTIIGEANTEKMNALKIFKFKNSKFFKNFPKDLTLDLTFMEGKMLYEKMNNLLDTKNEFISIKISYNKENIGYSFSGSNDYLEVRTICQSNKSIKKLSFEIVDAKLNPEFSELKFKINNETMDKIIKLSKLDKTNELISVRIDNNDIYFSEKEWDLKIGTVENFKNTKWDFKKEYLQYFKNDEAQKDFWFSIFSTFIVLDETKSYLMFAMDLTE